MLFSSRVRVRIKLGIIFSVLLVNCYARVFVLLSVVIVTLPSLHADRAIIVYVKRQRPHHQLAHCGDNSTAKIMLQ